MLLKMVDHNLGIVATEERQLVGFLTCYEPWNNHFGTAMGTFSPIHAHGAIKNNRKRIYSQMYQQAAKKWVKAGVLSHTIALYAHDTEVVNTFFGNGFGLRCIDAIRAAASVTCDEFPDYFFGELPIEEIAQIVPLKNLLIEHLQSAPIFMPCFFSYDVADVKQENERRQSRYFIAKDNNKTIAFIEIMQSGENFVCDSPEMINICGAYMLPEYRGSGIYTKLLAVLQEKVRAEGYTLCGVDFESLNPTANGFWLKYFTAYTYSVVRRIDERIYRT
ncbi:GNAT family N-acetyltransferase [Lucifera butyrica]|nr:GNAT family N-acetyltransferase [Lucifera butyrica]